MNECGYKYATPNDPDFTNKAQVGENNWSQKRGNGNFSFFDLIQMSNEILLKKMHLIYFTHSS